MARGGRPLVTVLGASGFIGATVVAALADRSIRLRPVSRRPKPVPAWIMADAQACAADLTVPGELRNAVADSDAVLYLVGHSGGWRGANADPASERVTMSMIRHLVDCLGSGRGTSPSAAPVLVFAGSTSQVGAVARTPIDGTEPDRPQTSYDRQKQAVEEIVKRATSDGLIRGISLRLPTIYGYSEPAGADADRGVLAAMTRRALAGKPLTMWHDGSVQRDLLHVRDVANAFLAALDHPDALAGKHWLLGSGRGEPLGGVFRAIAQAVAETTGTAPVPVVQVPPPADATVTDQHSVVIDSSAFRSATKWRSQISLGDGISDMVLGLARAHLAEAGHG
jgi:nucleoside-diphosphate-sugar epimerase